MPPTPDCCTPFEYADLPERLYCAYNRGGDPATAGLNYQGKPCPVWTELPENVRAKWEAVADEVRGTEPAIGTTFDFGSAVRALRDGRRVSRAGWNGKGMWLALQVPDTGSKMGHPYIYMSDVNGVLFPWNPNALDMLATDWGTL